jgi:apolipoprotein D and lipocalin family protein
MKTITPISALAIILALFLGACKVNTPEGARPVKPFDSQKYLGTWYEIARFDYRFEKNLEQVTATYSLNDNGTIRVDNKGYDTRKKNGNKAPGKPNLLMIQRRHG